MSTSQPQVRLATWNVNSIKARLPLVLDWLGRVRPDVVVLQELKCETQAFPAEPIEDLGYNLAVLGQKTYNGVAILSRSPIEDVVEGLPGDPEDEQARYLEATIGDLRVVGLYAPNGNPVDSPKYPYKLRWMERLTARVEELLESEQPLVIGGDYNVIPDAADCYDPAAWSTDALFRLDTRRSYRRLMALGLTDALRAVRSDAGMYTFWDYQRGAWDKDHGIRIDHWLLSPQAADRLETVEVDREERGRQKASDHVPVILTLSASD